MARKRTAQGDAPTVGVIPDAGAGGRRPDVGDVVAEGLYIASAATRLALKNRIVVETISSDAEFEVERFIPFARETLLTLAEEAAREGERAEKERRAARRKHTQSASTHDYRSRDGRNLKRRFKQSQAVAERLREHAGSDADLRALIEAAREAAWEEVASNIDQRLQVEAARPDLEPDYEKYRAARMQSLRLVDLPRLAAHRRRLAQSQAGEEPSDDPVLQRSAARAGGADPAD